MHPKATGASGSARRHARLRIHRGFSLIEVMISVAIVAVLLGVGVPAIGDWIQNRQVNALAESIASGLRMAQSQAVQRNVPVDLLFTSSDVTVPANQASPTLTVGGLAKTDATPNWMVRESGATTSAGFIQGKTGLDDGGNARFSGPAGVSFSPLGSLSASIAANGTSAAPTGTVVFMVVNPSVQASSSTQRCIYVSTGGAVRICDPRAASGDSRACNPTCAIP